MDGRGDVTALTDAQGQVVDQYGYDLWGAATAASGGAGALGLVVEGVPQPLRYRGYFYDAWYDGAGLRANNQYVSQGDRPLPWYWLGVRSYDPALERFLQPDPSAQDGARSYAYCHDAPADCADPSGLVSESTGPEPDPGAPIGPGLGAPGGTTEGAGLPVVSAGEGATTDAAMLPGDMTDVLPAADSTDAVPGTSKGGVRGTSGRNAANENGDLFHYDRLNSAHDRATGPTQLSKRYPDTEFKFGREGVSEPDVEVVGGKHPSQYEGSAWPDGYDRGDFKPLQATGRRYGWYSFRADVRSGKIDPSRTIAIFYDPNVNELYPESDLRGEYRTYAPPYPPVWQQLAGGNAP